jgi:hypothetical protein
MFMLSGRVERSDFTRRGITSNRRCHPPSVHQSTRNLRESVKICGRLLLRVAGKTSFDFTFGAQLDNLT